MPPALESLPALPDQSLSQRQERRAWRVLLGAFLVFCFVCIGSGLGLRYFLLDSTVPLQAMLTVGRGTAGLTGTDLIEQVVRGSREIANSSVIATDRQSQAVVSFYDPRHPEVLVASLTVRSDTEIDLSAMSRPRFDLSGLGYEITITETSGRLKLVIPDGLNRNVRVTLESQANNWMTITESGTYFVDVSAGTESVTNYGGSAALASADGAVTQYVADQQRGLFFPETGDVYLVPAPDSLINPAPFDAQTVIASDGTPAQLLLPAWRCFSVADQDPVGGFTVVSEDGRTALNMLRGGGAQSHGETLCSRTLNAGQGVDVTGYDSLALDVMFKIRSHSLSACGVVGSECPIMIRMDYIPVDGAAVASWFHGFFVRLDPAISNPLVCPSCTQEHEIVNANAWYNYQSENLFSLIPADMRPASVVNIVVYASGHEYDSLVMSAELFGGHTDPRAASEIAPPSP